jgi:uncharacterized Zn finger protein
VARTVPYIDTWVRDTRWARAAKSVLQDYTITPRPGEDGFLAFEITGGTTPYTVRVHPEWAENPRCSCPDARDRALDGNSGYCKHVIAVLLKHDELSYQLLELFL